MTQYNINVIRHDLDGILKASRSEKELYDMCQEDAIQYSWEFCERFATYEDYEKARDAFEGLVPQTLIYDGRKGRVDLRVTGYELEAAECNEDGEQYSWDSLDVKFEAISYPTEEV